MNPDEEQKKETRANAAKLIKKDQETRIFITEEKPYADVYSASPKRMRALDKLCKEHPEEFICCGKDDLGLVYKVSSRLIAFSKPRKYSLKETERRVEQGKKNFRNGKGGTKSNGNIA